MAFKAKFVNGLKTPKGRFIYPHLDKIDDAGQFPTKKFKVTLLIPKEVSIKDLKAACIDCAKQTWGENVDLKAMKWPFRDGDKKTNKESGEVLEGYEGTFFVTAKSSKKPLCVSRSRERMDNDLIKGGDYGRLGLSAMSYEGTENVRQPDGSVQPESYRGVTFLLDSVQHLEDGDPLGGTGGASAAIFDDGEYEDEESAVGSSNSDDDEELFGIMG